MLLSTTGYAWGPEGHRITGMIAAAGLNPTASTRIHELLGSQSMTDASTWADEVRGQQAYAWSAPLHYVNIAPGAEKYDAGRDCPEDRCVVEAIRTFAGALRDPAATREKKAEALRFLIHFVGDIHQPLHVSHARDKGGNDIAVEFFSNRSNLHRVWDSMMLRRGRRGRAVQDYARDLQERVTADQRRQWQCSLDPQVWAMESYRLAVSNAYDVPKTGRLEEEYFRRNLPVAEERLVTAGVRLAALLNGIFADQPTTASAPAR